MEMCSKLFRKYEYGFISALFPLVSPENENDDRTTKKIENSRNGICSNGICNCIFDYCGSQVIWVTECEFADCNTDVCIGSGKESQLIMKMAEPVILNPNNYRNVENILINMAESTDIANKTNKQKISGADRERESLFSH